LDSEKIKRRAIQSSFEMRENIFKRNKAANAYGNNTEILNFVFL